MPACDILYIGTATPRACPQLHAAFQQSKRCPRRVFAATSLGHLMMPGGLIASENGEPRRYKDPDLSAACKRHRLEQPVLTCVAGAAGTGDATIPLYPSCIRRLHPGKLIFDAPLITIDDGHFFCRRAQGIGARDRRVPNRATPPRGALRRGSKSAAFQSAGSGRNWSSPRRV